MALRDAEKIKSIKAVKENSLEPEQAIRLSLSGTQFTEQRILREPGFDVGADLSPSAVVECGSDWG